VYHSKVLQDKGIIDKGIIQPKVLQDKGIAHKTKVLSGTKIRPILKFRLNHEMRGLEI
jgi:hypothetical protein